MIYTFNLFKILNLEFGSLLPILDFFWVIFLSPEYTLSAGYNQCFGVGLLISLPFIYTICERLLWLVLSYAEDNLVDVF